MALNKSEILGTAIRLEKEGREYYLKAAEKASNDIAAKMFESFAADESRHIEWLELFSKESRVRTSEPKKIYASLQKIFAEASEETKREAESSPDDIAALNVAIDNEVKSMQAYAGWAKELEAGELRSLCETLAAMERDHRNILENVRDYLQNTGNWFMKEEQWIFDGG